MSRADSGAADPRPAAGPGRKMRASAGASSADDNDRDRILDRGYRAYAGPRSGLKGSFRSVMVYSVRSSLGLGRSARHKILPWLSIVFAVVPAVVMVGISVALDVAETFDTESLFGYHEYYGWIGLTLIFFCGMVVPEILVSDRRNGMLPLYLSTPLERWSYLSAKAAAVALTLCVITIGPVLLLMVAHTLEGSGPDGLSSWLTTFLRVVVAGAAISAPFSAMSLAAASLTDRRAIASVGVIMLLWGSSAVISALVDLAEMSVYLRGLDLGNIPYELVQRVFGEPGLYTELSTAMVALSNLGWVALGAAVVWWRYRRLAVSR